MVLIFSMSLSGQNSTRTDWRKEKAIHASSVNIYIQGGENSEPKLSSTQLHILVPQGTCMPLFAA